MTNNRSKSIICLCIGIFLMSPVVAPFAAALSAQTISQQGVVIKGVVIDEAGDPVIGASVIEEGNPTNGTPTDMQGQFSIKTSGQSTKVKISYIGYSQKIATITYGKTNRIVMSENSEALDNVIVVAFGEQKRSAFTGSASVVDSKTIENKQLTNALSGLQGEASGVQMVNNSGDPTAAPSIRIRGFSSINAGQDPLIVLDGATYEGGWNNINPSDIESITVLKDAASAALYGARGSNGVIMITTKRAQMNAGKPVISVDAKWGASTRIERDYETISDPGQYYETYYKALYNYAVSSQNMNAYNAHVFANETLGKDSNEGGLGYLTMSVPEGQYLIGDNGRLNPSAKYGNVISVDGKDYLVSPDNWMKEASRTGLRMEYNVNARGGNDKNTYYISAGYLKTEGIAKRSDFERLSTRVNATFQLLKWLKFSGNISYTRSKSDYQTSSNNIFSFAQEIAPIYPLYIRGVEGNVLTDKIGSVYDYGDGAVTGLNRPYQPKYNPLQDADLNTYNNKEHEFYINGALDITPFNGFKITLNGATNIQSRRYASTSNPFYGYSAGVYSTGYTSKGNDETYSYNFQQKLNYAVDFGSHNLSVLAGHESYRRLYDNIYGSRQGMASYFTNQNLSGAISVDDNGDNPLNYNNEGWFLRGMYDYDGKYFANVSVRYDGSCRFKRKWGTFYSFGGSWIMSREKFMEQYSWVNMLKLKASFGQVGNDQIGDFKYITTFDIVNSDGNVGLLEYSAGNSDITWETASSTNVGLEFELFKSRLRGGIEYYYKNTTDMLFYVGVPKSMGYGGRYHNIGDMSNQGVEIELSGDIIRTKNITWTISANSSFQKNRITKIVDGLKNKNVDGHAGYSNGSYYYGEGLSLYTWYLPRYAGLTSDGRSQWYKTGDDGQLSTTTNYGDADYYACGSSLPTVYGGFSTSLSAYNFDFSIQFSYSIGGKAYDNGYATLMTNPVQGTTGYAFHKDVLDAWSEANALSNIPRWQYGDQYTSAFSDRFLTDASSLTLSNINLGYTLPAHLSRKMKMTKVRFYVSASNLYYWTARKGFDPRGSFNGDISTSEYSPSRTISGGLTVTF